MTNTTSLSWQKAASPQTDSVGQTGSVSAPPQLSEEGRGLFAGSESSHPNWDVELTDTPGSSPACTPLPPLSFLLPHHRQPQARRQADGRHTWITFLAPPTPLPALILPLWRLASLSALPRCCQGVRLRGRPTNGKSSQGFYFMGRKRERKKEYK